MKKIIILVMLSFMITGCFDYREINKIDLITAIGIDYQNEEYIVTLEILNDKVDKENAKITSYIKTGRNKYLAVAIEEAANKLANEANYSHVRLMVLSKSVLSNKMAEIMDYFLRSINFRENFLIVSSLSDSPETILSSTTNEQPIASSNITELLNSNSYSLNNTIKKPLEVIAKELLTFGIDTCFSNVSLQDNNIVLDGAAIFSKDKYVYKLNDKEVTLFNILSNKIYHPIFSKSYNEKDFSIALSGGKIKIDVKDNNINVNGKVTGQIINNAIALDIRDLQKIKDINNDFQKILNNDIKEFIETLQKNKSDILGIDLSYYQNTKEKKNNYFLYLTVNSNIEFQINKKGIVYEVQNENKQ